MITLQAIQLQNFKKHADLTIQFSETLTVIKGPNWAGKSSILHAIFFALFGPSAVPCSKEKIPRRGEKNCKVTLWFSNDGVDHVLVRTLTTCQLFEGESLKATSASAVTEYVTDTLLRLNRQDALTLAYSPQSQTAALLTLGVPALNRMIESLTKADTVETLIKRAGEKVAEAEKKLSTLGAVQDTSEMEEQIQVWKEALEERQRTHDEISERHKELVATLSVLEQDLTRKHALNEQIINARSDRQSLALVQTALAQLREDLAKKQVADSRVLEQQKQEAEQAYQAADALVSARKAKEAKVAELESYIATSQINIDNAAPHVEPYKLKSEELVKTLELFNEAKAELTQATKDEATAIKAKESSICLACKRAFDEHDPSHLEEVVKAASERRAAAQAEVRRISVEHLALEADVAALRKLQLADWVLPALAEKREALRATQEALAQGQSLDQLSAARATAEAVMFDARQAFASAKVVAQEADQLKLRIQAQEKQAEGFIKALASAPKEVDPLDLEPVRARITEARQVVRNTSESRDEAFQEMTEAKTTLASWSALLKPAKATNEARAKYEKQAARFDAFQQWLRKSKNAFMGKIWDNLTLVASNIVSNATMGYANVLSRSEDGEFYINEDGEETSMISASGGMQSICGVALRLALDSVLAQSVGFVVLDEPSSELNDEHAASLAGALRGENRQTILVTHREGEEFVSDTVVELA